MADKVTALFEELMILSRGERERLRELLDKTSRGDFASNRLTITSNHTGMSGLISRKGRGASSLIRRRTPIVVSARNGGRPVHIA